MRAFQVIPVYEVGAIPIAKVGKTSRRRRVSPAILQKFARSDFIERVTDARQGCKSGIHNSLRNTVFRYARLAGLNPVLEATGLLPDDPNCRPADVLISAPPTLRQNSWSKYPRVALDVAVTSPFQSSALATNATGALRAASQYAQRKRAHAAIAARCAAVDLGFKLKIDKNFGCHKDDIAYAVTIRNP